LRDSKNYGKCYYKSRKIFEKNTTYADVGHCFIKHTLNEDGSRVTIGDLAIVKCIIDRKAERAASNAITYMLKK